MGLFSKKSKSRPKRPVKPGAAQPLVRVAFRELTQPVPDNGPAGRYVYRWPFPDPPKRGQRVYVPSDFGGGFAVVTGRGYAKDAQGMEIKTITRKVSDIEVRSAKLRGST